jgi:hypothetical protein
MEGSNSWLGLMQHRLSCVSLSSAVLAVDMVGYPFSPRWSQGVCEAGICFRNSLRLDTFWTALAQRHPTSIRGPFVPRVRLIHLLSGTVLGTIHLGTTGRSVFTSPWRSSSAHYPSPKSASIAPDITLVMPSVVDQTVRFLHYSSENRIPLLIGPQRHSSCSEPFLEERKTLRICVPKVSEPETCVTCILNCCLVA